MRRMKLHEEIADLLDRRDSDTIAQLARREHREGGRVEETRDDWVQVKLDSGFTIGVRLRESENAPAVDEEVTVLTSGPMGASVGLIDATGTILGYRTPLEAAAEKLSRIAARDREQREAINLNSSARQALYDGLSQDLRMIVDGWVRTDPGIVKDHLHYDLVALAMAENILSLVDANDALPAIDEITASDPGIRFAIDPDASGNQVDYAVTVARALAAGAALSDLPPAMAPLVGWPPAVAV